MAEKMSESGLVKTKSSKPEINRYLISRQRLPSDQMGDFKLKSTAENLQLWEQRVRERVQSGMTIGEWCKKNGVSKHQYNYWNHRVREKQKTGEETSFAEITPILSPVDTARQIPVLTSDFQSFFKSIRVSIQVISIRPHWQG